MTAPKKKRKKTEKKDCDSDADEEYTTHLKNDLTVSDTSSSNARSRTAKVNNIKYALYLRFDVENISNRIPAKISCQHSLMGMLVEMTSFSISLRIRSV